YDPRVAYGAWAYDDYPPYYFPPVYYQVVRPIPIFGPLWGWSSWDWRGRSLHLDVNRWRTLNHNRSHVIVGNTWHHDNDRNRGRTFRNRSDRTNFAPGARTPDGRGFGGRSGGNDRNNTGAFRGRERDGRDNNAGSDNREREGGRGFQRRQPAAPPAPSANATPAPQPGAPRGGFRDRGDTPRNRGNREQANREPTSPTVTQPAPGQPNTRQFNEGRFNRGEFNGAARGGNREGRGEGGERGRQRREEANIAPPAATPQARTFAPPPNAPPAVSPPGGRYRGDRPQPRAEAQGRAEIAQPRGGRFNPGPPHVTPPPQAPAAAQPQPQKDGDNPRRGRGRGGDDRPSR
ncbi:MAG: DUF3300 domain-containing protein, partial [Rhodospirillaceae bacterium]